MFNPSVTSTPSGFPVTQRAVNMICPMPAGPAHQGLMSQLPPVGTIVTISKRPPRQRVNPAQIRKMVAILSTNYKVFTSKSDARNTAWDSLAMELNSLGTSGQERQGMDWRECWIGLRYRTVRKERLYRSAADDVKKKISFKEYQMDILKLVEANEGQAPVQRPYSTGARAPTQKNEGLFSGNNARISQPIYTIKSENAAFPKQLTNPGVPNLMYNAYPNNGSTVGFAVVRQ